MRLDLEDREKAKKIFEIVGIKQKDFCSRNQILVSTLSSALTGKRSVPDEIWHRVLSGLEREIEGYKRQTGDASSVTNAQNLFSDLCIKAGVQTATTMASPGGKLPTNSQLYIQRDCDKQVLAALGPGTRTVALSGAPQSGRSSLLLRIHRWAEDSGFSVHSADFEEFIPNMEDKSASVDELFATIAMEMNFEVPSNHNRQKISSSIRSQILDDKQRTLIIVDNADNTALVDPAKTGTLLLQIVKLRDHFARYAPNKFVAVMVFGADVWSAYHISFVQAASLVVETAAFTKEQARQIGLCVTGNTPDEKAIEAVFDLFGGHAYLTHLLFEDMRHGKRLEDIQADVASLNGPYGAHADRIVRRMQQVTTNLVAVSHTSVMNRQDKDEEFRRLCREISTEKYELCLRPITRKWLRLFGIWDGEQHVCRLYKQAFAQQASP
ncbi:MAG: AAA-like domain [Bradyrhizobium sp.]|jgi:heme exporter protein D|nr:AAA-like domain [Bradyrhizobium sp.]